MKLLEITASVIEKLGALSEPYHEVEEYRDAWNGGIADFGNKIAGNLVWQADGYKKYQQELEVLARKLLGDEFTIYRYMTEEQAEELKVGAGGDAVAVTLSRDLPRISISSSASRKLACHISCTRSRQLPSRSWSARSRNLSSC